MNGPSFTNLSIAPDEADTLGTMPQALAVAIAAGQSVALEAVPCAFSDEGVPRPWSGLDAAAGELVRQILREQESHYCCADSDSLIVQWPSSGEALPDDLAEQVSRRLAESADSFQREWQEQRAAAPPPGVVSKVLERLLGPMLELAILPSLLEATHAMPGQVAEALHDVTKPTLTMTAGIHFQQGGYVAECTWWGSASTIEALRAVLCERLAPYGVTPS